MNRFLCFIVFVLFGFLLTIDGKGFGGGRGGGFKGGGSRGSGSFGGSSGYGRGNSFGSSMSKPRGGSSFKKHAMSFAAGAAGGVMAYSLMRSMSGHGYRPGYYEPGYGSGETCINNEDLNGTIFGSFRCPLNGFPREARYCCGEYGHQFCCIRERNRFAHNSTYFGWIVLIVAILLIIIVFVAIRSRRRQKDAVMVPTEPPLNDQFRPSPFYQPAPPTYGYPPPPGSNPYENPQSNFNPYAPPNQMPYPPQQPSY